MPPDIKTKSIADLKTLIENHERLGRLTAPLYLSAKGELDRRTGGSLTLDRTVALIAEAAAKGRFISYKTIADESGAPWNKVHFAMTKHLLAVSELAHSKGWPMLSAIVVNNDHLVDGGMNDTTLSGFCACAERLGYEVPDKAAFLKSQQKDVFAAAGEGKLG